MRRLQTLSASVIRFRCGFTRSRLRPGIYTPGIARDHGYRLALLDADRFAGRSVLDVGAFDGFYSFLAERRGARRVVAVDNEQYVDWVRARFGITLQGGAGFRAIAELVGSRVQYQRMDALDVHELGERFDVVLCFGILHRVTDPAQACCGRSRTCWLRAARSCSRPTALVCPPTRPRSRFTSQATCTRATTSSTGASRPRVCGDWPGSSGLDEIEIVDEPEIAGHPRILALLRAPG